MVEGPAQTEDSGDGRDSVGNEHLVMLEMKKAEKRQK